MQATHIPSNVQPALETKLNYYTRRQLYVAIFLKLWYRWYQVETVDFKAIITDISGEKSVTNSVVNDETQTFYHTGRVR